MGRPKTISDDDSLVIAREVFTTHGAFGSTKDIASLAGISEAALFKRFATKAQLFMAALVPPSPGINPYHLGVAEPEQYPTSSAFWRAMALPFR